MAYSSLVDLQHRLSEAELVQLTDDTNLGIVDSQIVAAAIAEADGLIDSFLRAQATLIASLSADLALYRLMARRGLGVAPEVVGLKEKAFALLEKLSKGELRLFAPEANGISGKSLLASGEADFNPSLFKLF